MKIDRSQLAQNAASGASEATDAARRIAELLQGEHGVEGSVTLHNAAGAVVELSPRLKLLLVQAAQMTARGATPVVMELEETLTTQTAANILNVSRQYMARLLDRGDVPSTRAGTHRRIRVADFQAFMDRRDNAREAALAMLTSDAEAAGAYDAPLVLGPRRRG